MMISVLRLMPRGWYAFCLANGTLAIWNVKPIPVVAAALSRVGRQTGRREGDWTRGVPAQRIPSTTGPCVRAETGGGSHEPLNADRRFRGRRRNTYQGLSTCSLENRHG